MNPEPISESNKQGEVSSGTAERAQHSTLAEFLIVAFVVLVLVVLLLPSFGHVAMRSPQTRALAQAKQIGLALKLFAADHDGNYPGAGFPVEMTTPPSDSNTAFATLFPTYIVSETIFGNKLSTYQTSTPDNVIDSPYTGTPRETLQPGENVYSYVMGLTDADDPTLPLVADGTDGGHYHRNPALWGGTWKGERAVVIRLDNSGTLETLAGPDDARFVPVYTSPKDNLFDFSRRSKPLYLLDPAVGPRRR